MKNIIYGIVLFIVAFAVALAATLPARWALQFAPLPPELHLDGVTGSLWSGKASTFSWRQSPPAALTWRASPLSLLAGRISGDVTLNSAGLQLDSGVTVYRDRSIRLSNATLNADVQALPIPRERMLITPEGTLHAEIESALLTGNALVEIEGSALWKPARITAPVHYELGEVDLKLNGQAGNIKGQLTGRNGPLDASGSLNLNPQGQLQTDLRLSPKPDTAKELRDLLPMLGKPAADGSVTLRRTLQLPPIANGGPPR